MSLPTADDLFRPTSTDEDAGDQAGDSAGDRAGQEIAGGNGTPVVSAVPDRGAHAGGKPRQQRRRSSGRVRHDEKMTVYVTAEELLDLEHARLALRRDHGIAVDRGRLVREALAIVLADLEHHADDSDLVKRLQA